MSVESPVAAFKDIRLDTDSLLTANRSLPSCWTRRTYILRPGPFHLRCFRRVLTEGLSVHRAGLSSGARIVAHLNDDALHLGIYKLRAGRFMHVEAGGDELCGVTLGGGRWEIVVNTESEGVMLLAQGELARRLIKAAQAHVDADDDIRQRIRDSFVLPPSPSTRTLGQRLQEALDSTDVSRVAAISNELPGLVEQALPKILPLAAILPKPRSQRRHMALAYEQRIWDLLPVRGALPDVTQELCEELDLTQRTLQMAVQEHFGLSCIGLQRTIRLNYARQLLADPVGARNVTDAALAAGFSHLGRFSQNYRALFGEHPSRTLALKSG